MYWIAIATLFLAPSLAAQTEDFDEPGNGGWEDTIFPNQFGSGNHARHPLSAANFAPDTTPALPINVGGDKEGRIFNSTTAPNAARFTDEFYGDVRLDGYFGIGRTSSFGSPSIGFRLRHGATPASGGYVAALYHNSSTHASVAIGLQCNGLIHASTVLATSIEFPVDTLNENYHLTFEAIGSELRLTVLRVHVQGGVVVEEPIDLLDLPGIQNELVASDSTYVAGEVGFHSFTGGPNFLFVDDMSIDDLGTLPGTQLCDGSTGSCPCANSTQPGEGCATSTNSGGRIHATGSTSATTADLRLTASQVTRNQFGLIFAGTEPIEIPFGDGLRCIGGSVTRFPVQFTGTCGVLDQASAVSTLGITAGETWYFGGWFRDPDGPCGTGFNFTPALEVTFGL